MQYRMLGLSGLRVSLMSLGSGGAKRLGQADCLTQVQQTAIVRCALDLGVNLIDTSATYGDSEIILGKALRGVPRDSYHLSTKWAPRVNGKLAEDPPAPRRLRGAESAATRDGPRRDHVFPRPNGGRVRIHRRTVLPDYG